MTLRIAYRCIAAALTATLWSMSCWSGDDQPGFLQRSILAFEQSDFEFQRSISNVPFAPLAFLTATSYTDVEVEASDGRSLTYDVDRISQMATIPILLGKRDALLVGEYVSRSRFHLDLEGASDFDVVSVGLPLGWFRQVNTDWQAAAFVMPLGNNSDRPGSDWSWQYLGGVFGRYIQNEQLWWAFGFYADVGSGDDFYIPYLGASWAINERWTLSAVMPWPALIYAPNDRWMFRLGATTSGASWNLDVESGAASVNLDAWDFGLSAEHRVWRNIWAGARAGASGLRGLRLQDSEVEEMDLDLSSNFYFGLTLNFRPAMRH